MSNAMSMALWPAVRLSSPWKAVTQVLAKRYCSSHIYSTSTTDSPVLFHFRLRSRRSIVAARNFSTTKTLAATVHNPPSEVPEIPEVKTPPLAQQRRVVKIGPLPDGPVVMQLLQQIFQTRISHADGNAILRILHHRRTSGSLADYGIDNLGAQYKHFERSTIEHGLEWLRTKYPVDEARAAEEWAEKEANRIAYELWLADPENDSKYKDPQRAFREQKLKEKAEREHHHEQEEEEGQRIGMLHVGPSQFERQIKEKRQERIDAATRKAEEKEAREREQEALLETGEWVRTPSGTQIMKPDQDTYIDVFGREQITNWRQNREMYAKRSETNFKSEEELVAAMTTSQRLVPMTLFVLGLVIVSYYAAHDYIPPSPEYRLWPDMSPALATAVGLVLLNIPICILWRWMPLWPFLTRWFMHVPGYPRAVQAITNVFSHVQYEHLLGNMMILMLVTPACHNLVDRGIFMGTYLSGGAVGTLFSLYWAVVGRGQIGSHSVGASGALWAVSTLFCLVSNIDRVKIPFLKDAEFSFYPRMLLAAFVVFEIIWSRKPTSRMTDHASHFGGMFVGACVAGWLHATGWVDQRFATVEAEGVWQGNASAPADKKQTTLDFGKLVMNEASGDESVKNNVD